MRFSRKAVRAVVLLAAVVLTARSAMAAATDAGAGALTFETAVRPILKASCFHCHGEDEVTKGGLDVRLVRLMLEGGESGSGLTPGDPGASLLWEKIASDEMPKGEHKLSPQDKARIHDWIEQGAATARPEPEDVADARFTLEELEHWSFQPLRVQAPPREDANPIDAFIRARLQQDGLGLSAPADRHTLIRRVSFDLTGLPPTPQEVAAFVDDASPDYYKNLVARLLESPQFGVRWARHWLDTAGFAESDGIALDARKREHAWRYRDYVIAAFNSNKPIDQFITEQLAGDELIEGALDIEDPRHLELLTATGFLRMAPDATQTMNSLSDRNTAVAAAIQVVSSSLLGVTVACAQCHDHKYDPIGIDDYYRFRAIFDPAFPLENWQQPGSRLVDMTALEVKAERDRVEAEAKQVEEEIDARRMAHCQEIQDKKLADVPEDVREATRVAVLASEGERDERQKQLLDLYPMVKPVRFISGLLVEYDGAGICPAACYGTSRADTRDVHYLEVPPGGTPPGRIESLINSIPAGTKEPPVGRPDPLHSGSGSPMNPGVRRGRSDRTEHGTVTWDRWFVMQDSVWTTSEFRCTSSPQDPWLARPDGPWGSCWPFPRVALGRLAATSLHPGL